MSPAASTVVFLAMRIAGGAGRDVQRLEALLAELVWAFPEVEAEIDAWAAEEGEECASRPV